MSFPEYRVENWPDYMKREFNALVVGCTVIDTIFYLLTLRPKKLTHEAMPLHHAYNILAFLRNIDVPTGKSTTPQP